MPAHRHDGGSFVKHFAHVASGVESDTNDNLWAWDGSSWQLIQPEISVTPGGLLPPQNVTAFGIDDHAASIGWDDPVQPYVEPTNVQYHVLEITGPDVWTEVGHPSPDVAIGALDPNTTYTFQVRYVVRVLGEITVISSTSSVVFTTLRVPVGEPAPDPGGTGGDSIIPIRPIDPGGGPVGGPGCWWAWELFIVSQTTLAWITTGITGTHPGNVVDFHYDLGLLDPTRVYRFEFCENCDGVLTGNCNFGPAFNGVGDWGADCGGIPASSSGALAAVADAIWAMPEICILDGHQGIFDRVSGTQLTPGGGFQFWFTDLDGEQCVKANTSGGNVWTTGLAVIETAIQPTHDFSIHYQWRNPDLLPDAGTFAKVAIGISHVLQLVVTATGWAAQIQFSQAGGGFLTMTSPEYGFDVEWHSMTLLWDHDGTKTLYTDGVIVDTDTTNVDLGAGSTILDSYVCGLAGGEETRMHLGWNRILSHAEVLTLDPPEFLEQFCDGTRVDGALGAAWTGQVQTNDWGLSATGVGSHFTISGNKFRSASGSATPKSAYRMATTSARNAWASGRQVETLSLAPGRRWRVMCNVGRPGESYPGPSSYYAAQWIDGSPPTISIIKHYNGTEIVMATMNYTVALNSIVRIRHNGTGGVFLDVDGVEKLSAQDITTPITTTTDATWLRGLGIGFGMSKSDNGAITLGEVCSGTWGEIDEPSAPWYMPDHFDLDTLVSPALWVEEGTGTLSINNQINTRYGIYCPDNANYAKLADASHLAANQYFEATTYASYVQGWEILLRSGSISTGYYFTYLMSGPFPFNTSWFRIGIKGGAVLLDSVDQGSALGFGRLRVEADGSQLKLYWNGVLKISVTNGAIAGPGTIRVAPQGYSGQTTPQLSDVIVGNL